MKKGHVAIKMKLVLGITVNPLFNDIRYNSKIRYNVNLVCTKSADRIFFIDIPVLFFMKTYVLCIC